MSRLVRLSQRYPRGVLVAALALTLLAVAGLVDPFSGQPRLRVDPSFQKLLPRDDPGRHAYQAMQDRFEVGESFVVALEPPGGAFRLESLETIAKVEARLMEFDEVSAVVSIASVPYADDGELLATSLLDQARLNPGAIADLQRALEDDPLYEGVLVSSDGGLVALHVSLESMNETDLLESNLGRRFETAARGIAPGWPVWIAGAPFLKAEMNRILNAELASQVPIVLLLMMVASAFVFRTVSGTWLPVATIVIALVWTAGAMGWIGHEINIVTSIVPPLILVVGFAYSIHVVAEAQAIARQDEEAAAKDRPSIQPTRGLEAIAFPIALTAVTTAAGFLSLGFSVHDAIREFGAFGAAGVLASMLASLTVTPAVLALAPMRSPRSIARRERWLDAAFERLGAFDLRHRRIILVLAVLAFAGSLAAATRIHVDTRTVENFRTDSLVRQSYERLNEALGGSDVLYVMLEGPGPGSLLEPARLREVAELQQWLQTQPEVGGTTSIVDYLEASRRALGGPSPLAPAASRSLVAQLLWLADGDATSGLIDRQRQAAVVRVRSRATSSSEIGALVSRIEDRLRDLPGPLAATVSGGSVLLTRAVDNVSRDQARSLAAAFGIIFLILAVAFRSPGAAALALLPNALPVAAYFGALGWSGVPLNNATALLGCVVLGIAIDDTLHFVSRHRECVRGGMSPSAAASAALAHVGRPVTWTTAALCAGLLVLTSSDLVSQAQFGALGALTLLFAWAVDVVLTPALCSFIDWSGRTEPAAVGATEPAPRPTSLAPVGWRSLAFRPNDPGRD